MFRDMLKKRIKTTKAASDWKTGAAFLQMARSEQQLILRVFLGNGQTC